MRTETDKKYSVYDIIARGREKLEAAGIPEREAEIDSELLWCGLSRINRGSLPLTARENVSPEKTGEYERLIDRRAKGEPLQYIEGTCDFMGLTFIVNKNVLIPRLDTEILAEAALKEIDNISSNFDEDFSYDIKQANDLPANDPDPSNFIDQAKFDAGLTNDGKIIKAPDKEDPVPPNFNDRSKFVAGPETGVQLLRALDEDELISSNFIDQAKFSAGSAIGSKIIKAPDKEDPVPPNFNDRSKFDARSAIGSKIIKAPDKEDPVSSNFNVRSKFVAGPETGVQLLRALDEDEPITSNYIDQAKFDEKEKKEENETPSRAISVLDLCTGSGAIGLSIAKLRPGVNVTCTDISPAALAVARENAKRLGVRVLFIQGDYFDPLNEELFDLIVSNPPYIPTGKIATLSTEVRDHEPSEALDGGPDGLGAYRRIIPGAAEHLQPGGRLLLEIGYNQRARVERLLRENGNYRDIFCQKDLAGNDRVIHAVRKY